MRVSLAGTEVVQAQVGSRRAENGGGGGTAVQIAVRCGRGGSLPVKTLHSVIIQPSRVDGRVKAPVSAEELK